MTRKMNAADRWLTGAELARDYGVPASALAPVLGLTEKACAARLAREGIDPEGGGLRLKVLRAVGEQLDEMKVTLADGGLEKAKVEALLAYVRALERVLDLLSRDEMREAAPARRTGELPSMSPEELAKVLTRIETRIDELARQRAERSEADASGGTGGAS